MDEHRMLAVQFEQNRPRLRAVAYRMLGSLSEAEDAVQEGWLRLNRSDISDVNNLSGWLTTVVARVCLDMLRCRRPKREESLEDHAPHTIPDRRDSVDPEQEALLADSVGLALLVVLETLPPAERLAFVLHDMFDLSFDEIAPIVDRSPTAARQLASRARRRVQGAPTTPDPDFTRQREIVEAFLAAARGGNFEALVALLDPDVVLRSDPSPVPQGEPTEMRGATAIAKRAVKAGARAAQPALINGEVGVIVAPHGRLFMILRFTITHGKIIEIETVSEPDRLRQLDLAILN